jgi:hypothetical protein
MIRQKMLITALAAICSACVSAATQRCPETVDFATLARINASDWRTLAVQDVKELWPERLQFSSPVEVRTPEGAQICDGGVWLSSRELSDEVCNDILMFAPTQSCELRLDRIAIVRPVSGTGQQEISDLLRAISPPVDSKISMPSGRHAYSWVERGVTHNLEMRLSEEADVRVLYVSLDHGRL